MSSEAMSKIRVRCIRLAARLSDWLGVNKENFLARAKEQLADILTSYCTIQLGSKMWIPKPEIKVQEGGAPYLKDVENEAYQRIQERFGTNGNFIEAFIKIFERESIPEIEDAIADLKNFLDKADRGKSNPRRLVPLLYAMVKESNFSHFAGSIKKFHSNLEDMLQMIADGKDPIKELKFDEYIEKLLRKEINRIMNH